MSTRKPKILLIFPGKSSDNYLDISANLTALTHKSGGMLILSLATVAALTPDEFDVKIVNENIEDINFEESCEIVGIGGFISQFFRAREIATEFKKRGKLIVCGGSSTSLSPERYRAFSDVLIIGEAERIWPKFLQDYLRGEHKSEYSETDRFDLADSPIPRYDHVTPAYMAKHWGGFIQTSRGCPYSCEFCDSQAYAGRKIRYKPVANILAEVEALYALGRVQVIGIADDNFTAGLPRAKKILRALRDWNRQKSKPVIFWAQFSINLGMDNELLRLAAEAGLTNVFVGIETPNEQSLVESNKIQNLKIDLHACVKNFHHHGIMVSSGCMVGFDHDDLSIFNTQLEFYSSMGIPSVLVWPLQVPDRTKLKERLVLEGRYLDWESNGNSDLLTANTFVPKNMSGKKLLQGAYWLIHELYQPHRYARRFEIFFTNYAESPFKNDISIMKPAFAFESVMMLLRTIGFILIIAPLKEKKAVWTMTKAAFGSSHPQRFFMLTTAYLTLKNAQAILRHTCPDFKQVTYPVES